MLTDASNARARPDQRTKPKSVAIRAGELGADSVRAARPPLRPRGGRRGDLHRATPRAWASRASRTEPADEVTPARRARTALRDPRPRERRPREVRRQHRRARRTCASPTPSTSTRPRACTVDRALVLTGGWQTDRETQPTSRSPRAGAHRRLRRARGPRTRRHRQRTPVDRLAERVRESRAQKGSITRDQHGRTRRAAALVRASRPQSAACPTANGYLDREPGDERDRSDSWFSRELGQIANNRVSRSVSAPATAIIIATPARSPRSNTPTKASSNATTREQMTTRSATDYATPSRNATISKQTRRSAPANDYVKDSNGRPHTNATTTAATASRCSTSPAPAAGSCRSAGPSTPATPRFPLTTLVTAAPLRSFLDFGVGRGRLARPEPKGWSAGFVSPTVSRLRRFLRVVQRT